MLKAISIHRRAAARLDTSNLKIGNKNVLVIGKYCDVFGIAVFVSKIAHICSGDRNRNEN
jgi:hypothetical protein